MKTQHTIIVILTTIALVVWLMVPSTLNAHCDTMNGPVVKDAKLALEEGDVTIVLKWVKPEYEDQIKTAFTKTLAVRSQSAEAKELADMYFFETLVRLHRAGEGAPYTGLKSAEAEVEPSIEAADLAIESGSVDKLVERTTNDVTKGIRERFSHAVEAKKHANESVNAGQEYVEAYVTFIHYVERLHKDLTGTGVQHEEAVKEDIHRE